MEFGITIIFLFIVYSIYNLKEYIEREQSIRKHYPLHLRDRNVALKKGQVWVSEDEDPNRSHYTIISINDEILEYESKHEQKSYRFTESAKKFREITIFLLRLHILQSTVLENAKRDLGPTKK